MALLSACSSGKGSFDLDDTRHTPPSSGSSRPTHQDVPSSPKEQEQVEEINQPALGYATEIPRRNVSLKATQKQDKVPIGQVESIHHTLNEIPTVFSEKIKKMPKFDKNNMELGDEGIIYSHNEKQPNQRSLTYVRSGYVLGSNKFDRSRDGLTQYNAGLMGYVFYQGHQPSTRMPTQTATYTGYWDFVSNASNERSNADDFSSYVYSNTVGNHVGATSLDEQVNRKNKDKPMGHSATFNADFGSKKLTGILTSNGEAHVSVQKNKERYKINADIKGNRFVGSATAKEKTHTIFGKDATNRLEGGFFGPKAEELAGKFLTNDNSLFVVFGAKRTETDDEKLGLETRFDAVKISTDNPPTATQGNGQSDKFLQRTDMDTFGNASYLVLDGRHFPLLPQNATGANNSSASNTGDFISTIDGNSLKTKNHENHKKYKVTVCCSNLQYVKFGSYGEQTTANGASNSTAGAATTHNGTSISQLTNGHLFLTGERTPTSVVEKQNSNAKYLGTWQANFLSSQGKVGSVDAGDLRNNNAKSRVEFEVNFGEKKVSGKFFDADAPTDKPALTMDNATIDKNGFSGTAKTTGSLQLDKGSTGAGITVTFTDAKVDGAFYGPNAEEIGGTITSNGTGGDKVGGVFGAKRQQESSAK
ncbi:transferrin-binding protein-like solute binding protein [Histophilus somni]|uniref:transferrin-binding protein-like solute binding protein n=2 Tax=Histophilus somni TaxID=731 RepID=UPI001FF77FA3|nr:transferrin-binding protein-like solute binding protein [Histophilus somni]